MSGAYLIDSSPTCTIKIWINVSLIAIQLTLFEWNEFTRLSVKNLLSLGWLRLVWVFEFYSFKRSRKWMLLLSLRINITVTDFYAENISQALLSKNKAVVQEAVIVSSHKSNLLTSYLAKQFSHSINHET